MEFIHVSGVFLPHHDFDGQPRLVHFFRVLGSSMAFLKTAWSFFRMESGMPLGTAIPRLEDIMTAGYPCSIVVGIFG